MNGPRLIEGFLAALDRSLPGWRQAARTRILTEVEDHRR